MPSAKPLNAKVVLVLAVLMLVWFQRLSAAPVMSASVFTFKLLSTRYAVPTSLLCTTALPVLNSVAVVRLTVGAVVSAGALETASVLELAALRLPARSTVYSL